MDIDLYQAVLDDDSEKFESVLSSGGDPDAWLEDVVNISGKSMLHVCCEKGRYSFVKILLEYGAQADIQGSWGQTPLMLCILVEYFDIAEMLLNNNPSIIDQQDSSGNTPLHIAIGNDSVEGVELLVRHNADVNIMNTVGITPMMKICSTKESEHMPEIVQLLIKGGANIDARDFKSRRTALHRAVLSRNIKTVEVMLNAGADVNSQDNSGCTPLSSIVNDTIRNYETTKVIPDDVMTIIHILVVAGTNLNLNSHEHSNPMIKSIQYKCTPLVNYFIVNGALVHGTFFGGITPVHHAVNKNDMETVKVLLNWSCDINRKARMFKYNYDTLYDCFELAIHKEFPDMAVLLVQAGYNASKVPYLTDFSAEVPACLQNRPDVLEQLRECILTPPPLFTTAVMAIRNAIKDNIAHQADLLPLPKLLIEDVKLRCILS